MLVVETSFKKIFLNTSGKTVIVVKQTNTHAPSAEALNSGNVVCNKNESPMFLLSRDCLVFLLIVSCKITLLIMFYRHPANISFDPPL